MQMFDQLNYAEQLQRWEQIARRILRPYGIRYARLTLLTYSHNAVFEVYDDKEGRFVLRLHRPGTVRLTWLRSELLWLRAMYKTGDIIAPSPIRTWDGDLFASFEADDLPAPVYAVMFRYIEGETRQPSEITPGEMRQVGKFLAKLHSAQFTPPGDFERPRLDWEGLFGENSPYNPGASAAIFTDQQREIFDAAAETVRAAMGKLGQGADAFGLIHGDLLCKNILFHGGAALGLDFEYCGYGYYLYDLSPLLWQLKNESERYPALETALWEGYTSVKSVPDEHHDMLEVFIAGRQVASCRWLACNLDNPAIREQAPKLLEQRAEELRRYLKTGRLERTSITL